MAIDGNMRQYKRIKKWFSVSFSMPTFHLVSNTRCETETRRKGDTLVGDRLSFPQTQIRNRFVLRHRQTKPMADRAPIHIDHVSNLNAQQESPKVSK